MVDKVTATPAALDLIERLKAKHGQDLMFHQSGGCRDNSASCPARSPWAQAMCTWATLAAARFISA